MKSAERWRDVLCLTQIDANSLSIVVLAAAIYCISFAKRRNK